jgi:PAS domain S-box-containing protein
MILVVTQDTALSQTLEQYLHQAYDETAIILAAANTTEAHMLCHTQQPDYVLLDQPPSDGTPGELLNLLKQEYAHQNVPVIIITDPSQEGAALQLTYQGAHDSVVVESLTAPGLRRAMENVLHEPARHAPPPETAAEAARPREFQLSAVMDQISAGLIVVDSAWRCRYINAGALNLLGGTRRDYLDRSLWERYPQGTSSTMYRQHHAIPRAGITIEEYDPAQQIWFDLKIEPVEAGYAIYFINGTRHKQQQQIHEQRERKLQTLLQNMPDIVSRFDREFRHLYVSPAIERPTGLTPEQMVGKTTRELGMDPAICDLWEDQLWRVFAGAESAQFEFMFPALDGSRFYHTLLVPEYGRNGEVETVLCLARDVTASRTAQATLQFLADASARLAGSLDYDATLRCIAELAVPGLADWSSLDLRNNEDDLITRLAVTTTNSAGQALTSQFEGTRYPLNLAAAAGCCRVLWSGEAELWTAVPDMILCAADYNDQQRQELRRLNLRSMINVPLIARERVFGVLSLATTSDSERRFNQADLTLAEELARRAAIAIDNALLYREAQQAVHERDAFLSVASHELRNPLAGLIGRAELLQRRIRKQEIFDERDQRDIAQVIVQAQRINAMLTDLLDRSVVDTNQLEIHPARLDLNALVHQVVNEIKPALTNHWLTLQSAPEPVVINGDSVRLEQVVYNLISNAIKYSPSGSKISLAIGANHHWASIQITDEGIGIPAEALPHIFKRFYRVANAAARGHRGSGIGLYVVKDVITRHNGQVEVSSEEGVGSTFTIRLPLIDAYIDAASTVNTHLNTGIPIRQGET